MWNAAKTIFNKITQFGKPKEPEISQEVKPNGDILDEILESRPLGRDSKTERGVTPSSKIETKEKIKLNKTGYKITPKYRV